MKKLLMALALMPLMVIAETWTDPSTGIIWTYISRNDGTASLGTGWGDFMTTAVPVSTCGALTVPASINGRSVTIIEEFAFDGCYGLTSVVIPPTVTEVRSYAFNDCSALMSVTMPSSVVNVGRGAFAGCERLTSVMIPSSVASIGADVFSTCSLLTEIIVDPSNGVYASEDGVLYNKTESELIQCPAGKTGALTISSGVTSIGDNAFFGCSGLKCVTMPSSVARIGYQAFRGCSGLTSVTMPSSVTSIDGSAFSGCSGLTEIVVDSANGVYASEDGVLYDKTESELIQCPAGKAGALTIPFGVTSIGSSAFSDCSELTSVTIPSSVKSIGSAFPGNSRLTEIVVDSNNKVYATEDGVLYNKTKSELIQCPAGKTGTLTIPSSVTSIRSSAFYGCSGLTSVTMPSNVTSIGDYAFYECSDLTSVTLPSSVTSIGRGGVFRL